VTGGLPYTMSAPAPSPDPASEHAHEHAPAPLGRSARYRRLQAWTFGISAVLHLAALALYPRLFGGLPETRLPGASDTVAEMQGIEVLNLRELDEEIVEPRPEPETERVPIPVAPTPTPVRPDAEVAGVPDEVRPPPGTPGRTAAERLQPSTNDARLWQPIPDEITALTPEQLAENLLYGRLQALNDSAALAAARAARATDWTYTDADGNKWGVSPGKLHLGPVTLPLPFAFGLPAGASDVLRRGYEQDAEIRRAAGQLGVDESLEQRNEAIRRREAERRRARPDTSGVRRP
jgi:hypothetical protein